MKCTEFEQKINEYVDGELKESVEALETHMASCSECRALYEETMELKALMADLDEVALPDDFEAELHEKLVAAKNEMTVVPFYRHRAVKAIGSIAAVAVLSFIVIKAGSLLPQMGGDYDDANMNIAANDSMNDSADMAMNEADMSEAPEMASDGESEEMATMTIMAEDENLKVRMTESASLLVAEDYDYLLSDSLETDALAEALSVFEIRELDVQDDMITGYVTLEVQEEIAAYLNENYDIASEVNMDFSKPIAELYGMVTSQEDKVEGMMSDETIDPSALEDEKALLNELQDQQNQVEAYAGYVKIRIRIQKEDTNE